MGIHFKDILAFLIAELILLKIVPYENLVICMQICLIYYVYCKLGPYVSDNNNTQKIAELKIEYQNLKDKNEEQINQLNYDLATTHQAPCLTKIDRYRIAFMSSNLVILRLIGIAIFYTMCWILIRIATFKYDLTTLKDKPLEIVWRRRLIHGFLPKIIRMITYMFGYNDVNFNNEIDNNTTPIYICNHVSFIDPFILNSSRLFCVVGASNQVAYPLMGDMFTRLQYVTVDRTNPESKKSVLSTIKSRATELFNKEKHWLPFLIFPEGTTTNGESIINFRLGAFSSLMPIQPYVIKYPNYYPDNRFHPSWTQKQQPLWLMIVRMLSEPVNYVEVHQLGKFTVKDNEDATQYMNRIREQMGKTLNVETTNVDSYTLLGYKNQQ